MKLSSFETGSLAVVIGASGGIGGALVARLKGSDCFADVIGLSRRSDIAIDITSEESIAVAAARLQAKGAVRLVVIATGFLHGGGRLPEKSWDQLSQAALQRSFLLNVIGPALILKHFLPILPRTGKSVCVALSARVGSIGDNELGGWYSYRASKAALNQVVRTASIELRRKRSDAICVALHPGTVATALSAPFVKAGLDVQQPESAAEHILSTVDALRAQDSGRFFDSRGHAIPW